mmetsp:Transcript_37437/g.80651  ORF Transcript_37437/g.80651 Transcript_37437/m.80651 type:complete len:240 (-) Transcript_37437:1665-2384(-)
MSIGSSKSKGRNLGISLVCGKGQWLGFKVCIEHGVLQVRIQGPQVLSWCALGIAALHDALHNSTHRSTTLQVPNVCLRRANHQRLCARLSNLNFAHCSNLNGISKRCACAMAFPGRRLWRCHQGFFDCPCHHLLLGRTIWSCQRGTSTILPTRSGTENGHALLCGIGTILHHESTDSLTPQITICRGVEGEAPALGARHVRLGASNEGPRRQTQMSTHRDEELQRIKLLIANHKSGAMR